MSRGTKSRSMALAGSHSLRAYRREGKTCELAPTVRPEDKMCESAQAVHPRSMSTRAARRLRWGPLSLGGINWRIGRAHLGQHLLGWKPRSITQTVGLAVLGFDLAQHVPQSG